TFQGQAPPGRLAAMPRLRRVRSEVSVLGFAELFGSSEVAPVIGLLLRRSPMTQLLGASREGPAITWEDAVVVLREPELARAVAYAAVRGADAREQVARPARMANGFEQMLERSPAEGDVRAVAAFLVYLNGLF